MSLGSNGPRSLVGILVVVLVVVFVGSAAVTGAFAATQQPSGDEVLDRVEQRYETAETVTSVATLTVQNDSESMTATVEVAATADNRSRTIITQNGTTYRMGSNGAVVWTVGPNQSAVWPVEALASDDHNAAGPTGAEDMMPDEQRVNLSEGTPTVNASNVSTTLVGTPSVDGTSTYKLELTHPEVKRTTSLWVSQADYSLVKSVTTDGTNRTVISVESTEFNVSVHDSTFDPPSERIGISTVDQYDEFETAQSATELVLPQLDDTFAEATVTVRQNETFVGQRYAREDGNVSIISTTADDRFNRMTENASTTTIDGQTVAVTTAEDRATAAWTDDGVTTVVVVDGSTDHAVETVEDLLS